MEESKEPRLKGPQGAPEPSPVETTGSGPGQESLTASELPAAAGQTEETGVPRPLAGPDLDRQRYLVPGALAVAVVAFAAVGIFVLGMFTHSRITSNEAGGGQQAVVAQPTAGPTPTLGPVEVSADDSPSLGPANASVTIIEFADYQCPYCGNFQSGTFPQIMQNYGDRVRFVYRNFPLISIHQYAQKAAEAAECANAQGAFWKYHDLLFKNQTALDVASLKNYAASLGLDAAAFNDCLDSDKYAAQVSKDTQDGTAAGVQGTPWFFINGMPITGAYPYSTFQAAINAALKEAGQ